MRNAKQEILDALNRLGSSIQEFRPDQYKELRAINKILETHELVPVDTRPFDPALCGFTITEDSQNVFQGHKNLGDNDRVFFVKSKRSNTFTIGHALGATARDVPWPETQSDGEALLRLLGALA